MAICRTCNNEFHHCSSCGGYCWESDYCCENCFYNSRKVREGLNIMRTLTKEQFNWVYHLSDDELIDYCGRIITRDREDIE